MLNKIIWKSVIINGIITGYEISNNGLLRSFKRNKTGKILSPSPDQSGYLGITLKVDGKSYWKSIHQLVAIAFIPNPENKPEVNHKDGDKRNNWDWNLEWMTKAENIKHAVDMGLRDSFLGVNSPKNVYSEETIHQVCKLLEKGKSQKFIANKLSVNKGIVNSIKQRKIWKHISKNYDIPKPVNRSPRPSGLRSKVIDLLYQDMDISEILLSLGLPDTRQNRTYVHVIRHESGLQSSTTIESHKIPIEEEVVFNLPSMSNGEVEYSPS